MVPRISWPAVVLASLTIHVAAPLSRVAADDLPDLLSITWRRGVNLPQGFQDSDGGVLNRVLVSVGGFCSGNKDVPGKPDKYPRGFLKRVWGLPLATPDARWEELPEFPGDARQGLDVAVVADQLYAWGGFSYSAPFCYRDGYRLAQVAGQWRWSRLPDLPWALAAHGSCRVGSRVIVVGGADYDGETGFFTASDRAGNVPRLGARWLEFDTARPDAGWMEGPACPGTPRFVHAVAAVGQRIYVMGGAASAAKPADGTFTVVDNWRYDLQDGRWTRLPDLPIASGNFCSGAIVFADRYLLLIGGYQYGKVLGPDGSLRDVYGVPTRHYPDNAMCSDVFVFDTKTERFGRATPLPLNNNLPMAVLEGDQLHLIGGEIGKAVLDGEPYGHHPDLYLIGAIRSIPP